MQKILKIKKRNGGIVAFDELKIINAIKKAFSAITNNEHEEDSQKITAIVIERLAPMFKEGAPTPGVEDVQDLVEKGIMEAGYFDVAKAYILYRYEHTKKREAQKQEIIKKIEERVLLVTKRDGKKEKFSIDKLKRSLSHSIKGYESIVDVDVIVAQCQEEVYEGIKTSDIKKALIMTTRSLIEQDPAYSSVAARLLMSVLYKEVIGMDTINFKELETQYRKSFIENIRRGVEMGRLDKRMLDFDLSRLSKFLKPERDNNLFYLGLQTLHGRYFVSDSENGGRLLETPQMFWMRVAMGLSILEKDKNPMAEKFYEIMSTLRFIPSTPTLLHSGTVHPQLSSCYLNTVADDLTNIFKTYADNAQLSKWSGGIGTDWTQVRATGAMIKKTGVPSQGVIPFLKIANDVTVAINRSGKRRGATCVYLETWHHDIEDFLELRKNTGDERRRTHDINTANWIPDLFMKRVRGGKDWTLFSPDEVPDLHDLYGKKFDVAYEAYEQKARDGKIELFKVMKARDLWKKMINMLFETGHPWVTFKDPANIRSPQDHVGVVHNSNLCTEITLNNSETETAVCNLGSINFAKHVTNGKFNETMIKETTMTAMRMLDNVIDVNFYPTEDARLSNMNHRPVGLGIMGFHDALYMMDINFDSDRAVDFADKSMELISYHSILASTLLAKERGAYSTFKGSKWDRNIFPVDTLALLEAERGEKIDVERSGALDWTPVKENMKAYGMRNSNTMAMAPTATISNIAGSIPTIEPIYKNIYVKSNQAGDFTVVNPYLVEDLKKLSLWSFEMLGKIKFNDGSIKNIPEIPPNLKDKYKEVFEIKPEWLIKSAAYRGKWIDQSQSLNIYYSGSSGKELGDIYDYAWRMGLKTTYYLRSMAASQVEKSTVNASEYGSTHIRKAGEGHVMSAGASMAVPEVIKETKKVEVSVGAESKLCKIEDPDCEACQ
ncbi:MAG: ribonucleoside-diphosphate reductase subunit alpha [Candidatus Lloydbacteria bacterium RIFCSPHIGHO2_01_FULL_41_20]|uniref:Ribonucleoside-diphosphate reductase n=1 Tax=Candidatus Lloydbacteria bacterium RIFCSPHIGHO2_01_FULL_41_20 TaxID=1798657 RepID=A0A1G2CU40_9BACT|nr:MAG: ribonucleoside-diphosphate reductase subunit alpha [Candidatus Lloydbacteria bacterium RIFCSPHIGHO2_01_FULL_41_20]